MGKLTGYRWISYFDDVEEKRFSDWDRAETCLVCGRSIVHVYEIETAAGETLIAGKECAHKLLGWARPKPRVLETLRRKVEADARRHAEEVASWDRTATKFSQGDPATAAACCRDRNNGFAGDLTVLEKADRFYAVPTDCTAQVAALLEGGWERV